MTTETRPQQEYRIIRNSHSLEDQQLSVAVHARGLTFDLPPQLSRKAELDPYTDNYVFNGHFTARNRLISFDEEWLKSIVNNSILKDRYPTPEDGLNYMEEISTPWRDRLVGKAQNLTDNIVATLTRSGHERFAVILFGSVARNLVKRPDHQDPSNIDLAVIGNFDHDERNHLLNLIRSSREAITAEIIHEESCGCKTESCQSAPKLTHNHYNETNVDRTENRSHSGIERTGVMIQSVDCVRKDELQPVRNYLSSCAIPLYDQDNIWKGLVTESLPYLTLHNLAHCQRRIARKYELEYWINQSEHYQY